MMKYVEKSSTGTHSVGYTYDDINNLTALVETINDVERTTSYTYDEDNRPTSVNTEGSSRSYTYDNTGRLSQDVTKQSSTELFTRNFTYCNGATSTQIGQINYTGNNYSTYFNYSYETRDLISSVITDGNMVFYDYDDANQLIRESVLQNGNGITTTCWTYDDAGNILKREVYPYGQDSDPSAKISEVVYTYGDNKGWGDLLTAYNGVEITHDDIGNPLNDGTWTYTWQHGRQLASMSKLDSSAQWSFTYNADGLRTQRKNTVTNRTYNYTYLGDQLTHMTVDGHTMYFTYDAAGTPMSVTYDGVTYYYVTNLQGDVVAILNSSGTEVVRYAYDAWGNLISTDCDEEFADLGFYNPLRYRGYVYDFETELYYLQSRYYNPEMGRFINADAFVSNGQGILGNNTFVYCSNNPVMLHDPTGEYAIESCALVCVLVIGGLIVANCAVNMITTAIQWAIDQITEFDYSFQQATKPISETYFPTPEVPAQVEITIPETIYDTSPLLEAKTKGKQNVRDTGLRDVPDEEVYRRARDKTLPPSERQRYQKEEKGRGYRNIKKRKMHYSMPVGGFHLGMFRRSI